MEQRNYDADIERSMASLDALYTNLIRHPYARGERADEEAAGNFLEMLRRSSPLTETDKIVQAVVRWQARQSRSAFIKTMFEGRYACLSLLVDGRMAGTGLNTEARFSINSGADGYRVGPPRSSPGERNPGEGMVHQRHPGEGMGHQRHHKKGGGRGEPGPQAAPPAGPARGRDSGAALQPPPAEGAARGRDSGPDPQTAPPAGPARGRDSGPDPRTAPPAGPARSRDSGPDPQTAPPAGQARGRDSGPDPQPAPPAGSARGRPGEHGGSSAPLLYGVGASTPLPPRGGPGFGGTPPPRDRRPPVRPAHHHQGGSMPVAGLARGGRASRRADAGACPAGMGGAHRTPSSLPVLDDHSRRALLAELAAPDETWPAVTTPARGVGFTYRDAAAGEARPPPAKALTPAGGDEAGEGHHGRGDEMGHHVTPDGATGTSRDDNGVGTAISHPVPPARAMGAEAAPACRDALALAIDIPAGTCWADLDDGDMDFLLLGDEKTPAPWRRRC